MYRQNGQQILFNDKHFADARDIEAAQLIVDALNSWCNPLNAAVLPHYHLIDPDTCGPERESDYDWDDPRPRRPDLNNHHEHHIARQSDEYACSCGVRWSVDEGEDHP